jgi:colanic acid/amylovoran biosynthesis glycosyltransferase
MIRQIGGLLSRGHEVDIYAFKGDPTEAVQETVRSMGLLERTRYLKGVPEDRFARHMGAMRILCSPHFRHRRLALNVWRYGRGALASRIYWLNSAPKNGSYDVIHCQFAHNGVAAVWWRKAGFLSGKVVTTFHGADIACDARSYAKYGYERLFDEGDAFTANSRYTADRAVALGCPRARISVLPMGLDIEKYEFLERTSPGDRPVRLLTIARLTKQKGIEFAIRAMAMLVQSGRNVEYSIVGDGHDRPEFEHLIQELGLAGRVQLLGWKTEEQLRTVCRTAHLFILPSITGPNGQQEAQGVVFQEAQACGLPVVATRSGGIPESIVEGQSGFLVPEKDPEALAERIGYLLDHPEMWPEMGRAGRRYVESKFEIGGLTDRLVGIYESLLNGKDSQ